MKQDCIDIIEVDIKAASVTYNLCTHVFRKRST